MQGSVDCFMLHAYALLMLQLSLCALQRMLTVYPP